MFVPFFLVCVFLIIRPFQAALNNALKNTKGEATLKKSFDDFNSSFQRDLKDARNARYPANNVDAIQSMYC